MNIKKSYKYIVITMLVSALMFIIGCGNSKEEQINGNVQSYSDDVLTMISESGDELELDVADAIIQCANDIEENNYITVFYTGSLESEDYEIIRVIDYIAEDGTALKGDEIVSESTGEVLSEGGNAVSESGTISGTVLDVNMNMIKIRGDEDRKTYTFNITFASQNYPNGVAYGTHVTVGYGGQSDSEDLSDVTVLRVSGDGAEDMDNSTTSAASSVTDTASSGTTTTTTDSQGNVFEGVVTGSSGYYLTVEGSDGKTQKIYTKKIPLYYPYGLQNGTPVSVVYTGSSIKYGKITSITGMDTKVDCYLIGTINEETTDTTLVLDVAKDVAPVSFSLSGAKNNTVAGLTSGGKVQVYFSNGCTAGSRITATQIVDAE